MRTITFFLFLLAINVTASNVNVISNRAKREAVLIRSKRRWVLSTIDLEENMPGPYPIKVTQMYNNVNVEGTLKFRISGEGVTKEPEKKLFSINETSGVVYAHRPIDREKTPLFHVDFDVLDWYTGQEMDKTLSFNVEIKDKNDNKPEFTPATIRASVAENSLEGSIQAILTAHDNDQKDLPNSQFTMRLVSQEPASPELSLQDTQIDPKIRQLAFKGCFDYDKAKLYKVLVEAKDQGTPPLSSTATVFLDITDSNTHLPEFNATTYSTEVMEMESNKEILRIGVKDKDTPNTPASRAVFSIKKGNNDGNYKIETDPKTNEGVLSVIKGKNFEKTEITELEIEVANEQKLFQCVNGKAVTGTLPKPNSVKVAVKVIDANDPPVFKKRVQNIFRNENSGVGDVLFTPEVKDEDSDVNNIRFTKAQDPGNWVNVDPKTGKITTVQNIDRESRFIKNGSYPIVIHAIDDGQPPATGTCTVMVYVGDANDNSPYLVSNSTVMCGNKADRVKVIVNDLDAPPFGGPFSFSLAGDGDLAKIWKLDPTTGDNTSLICLKALPYGNYSIPLTIQDQQGFKAEDMLHVQVCDCAEGNVCRGRLPLSSKLGLAAIGLLLSGILLLAFLLLFCILCECKSKNFQHIPLNPQDEGNQTLVKYNLEGGGSMYKSEPIFTSTSYGLKENMKMASGQSEYVFTDYVKKTENGSLKSPAAFNTQYISGMYQEASNGGAVMSLPYQNFSMVRTNTVRSGVGQFSRSYSQNRSDRNLAEHIDRKIYSFTEEQKDVAEYSPYQYGYEGSGSDSQSLDQLSLGNLEDNLDFLQNLGPKFNALGGICQQSMNRENVRL